MKIAVAGANAPGVAYRANDPILAMLRRGHTVLWPNAEGALDTDELVTCDVLHVYRFCDPGIQQLISALIERGIAVVYDNDDDYFSYSEEFPAPHGTGEISAEELADNAIATAKLAQVATFPSEVLADIYRSRGVEQAEVIPSAPRTGYIPRFRQAKTVIGWIAGNEPEADARILDLTEVFQRLQAAHPDVHVEAIGVDLGLSERYTNVKDVPFDELPRRISRFDIGIAPLADVPFNHSRSDIKIKEYAGAGVAWLASSLSPYLPHAEGHGGRLVPADGWFEALDTLVRDAEAQQRLALEGRAWALTQRIDSLAERWEQTFEEAIARVQAEIAD